MTKRKTFSMVVYTNGEKAQTVKCASLKDARATVKSYMFYDLSLDESEMPKEAPSFDNGFIYTINDFRFIRIIAA